MGRLDAHTAVATGLSRDEAMAILEDHNRRTTHVGELQSTDCHSLGYNPACGDRYDVFFGISDEQIDAVRFNGFGCVISRASASMMAVTLEGVSTEGALVCINQLRAAVLDGGDLGDLPFDLNALLGVRDHPSRVKCVLLPWQAAEAALKGQSRATTE